MTSVKVTSLHFLYRTQYSVIDSSAGPVHRFSKESTISVGERPAAAHLLRSWVWIPSGAWIFVCCECRVLSGRGLCDGLITRTEESYRLWRVVVCDLETSRIGAPYIYDISSLRVNFSIGGGPLFTSEILYSGHSTRPPTKRTQCFSFCPSRNFPVQPQFLLTLPFFIVRLINCLFYYFCLISVSFLFIFSRGSTCDVLFLALCLF